MPGPVGVEITESGMQSLQGRRVIFRGFIFDYDQKINIAIVIEIANGKGALEIGGDEVIAQNRLDAGYQVA